MSRPDNYAEVLQQAVEILKQDDYAEDSSTRFISDYSGRFMYGKTTPAIVLSQSKSALVIAVLKVLANDDPEMLASTAAELLPDYCPERTAR